MYIPAHYAETDPARLRAFIRQHPFGQLVSVLEGRLVISHLPFLLNDHGTHLQGHFAYGNPQWDGLEEQEVLVSFLGEHSYVSPALYEKSGVPTWNYQAVHVYGTATVFHDPDEKRALLEALTREQERHREEPWLTHIPSSMLGSVVGFEVEIREIQGKFKLSQNRPQQDRDNVAQALLEEGSAELARAMQQSGDRSESGSSGTD